MTDASLLIGPAVAALRQITKLESAGYDLSSNFRIYSRREWMLKWALDARRDKSQRHHVYIPWPSRLVQKVAELSWKAETMINKKKNIYIYTW